MKFNHICLKEELLPKYTHIKLHDDAAQDAPETRIYRRKLVERQLRQKEEEVQQHNITLASRYEEWYKQDVPEDLRNRVEALLQEEISQHRTTTMDRTQRKLIKLNGGHLRTPQPTPGFINLSNKILNEDQTELLNLGLNCHVISNPRPYQKRLEIETLMADLHKLAEEGKVLLDDGIREDLLHEARIQRGKHTSSILKRRHKEAAKQLRTDADITIRKADKAATYVILPTSEYHQKIDNLLADPSKFKKISRNPIEALKTKINKTIDCINALQGGIKFQKLIGEYQPGYCYGNVKTHKNNNPLRPIISQIPTPTYHLAKKLNALLTPFTPTDYSINSPADFLTILKGCREEGNIASLDVESLFTNVPVDRTISYIIQEIYPPASPAKLNIPKHHLQQLLEICTKEAPFRCPKGNLYKQIDGVAMGSPLGVLFANFFMGMVERETFRQINKPSIYVRYIDDIFVLTKNQCELTTLKNKLQNVSGLTFTMENSTDDKLPFLDVMVSKMNPCNFKTSVYTKPTNPGLCLNGNSECPQRYKTSTINAYVRRALSHCSDWNSTHTELERATQVLINNGYSNKEVQKTINRQMEKWYQNDTNPDKNEANKINIFYRNTMSTNHQAEEDAIKKIIKKDVQPAKENDQINLVIYYKSMKTSNLLIRNNENKKPTELQSSHLVYEYTCKHRDCSSLNSTYIGMTTTSLSRRITMHLSQGAIRKHHSEQHNAKISRQNITQNIVILHKEIDCKKLHILEALYIRDRNPSINKQNPDPFVIPSSKIVNHKFRIKDISNNVAMRPPAVQAGVPS